MPTSILEALEVFFLYILSWSFFMQYISLWMTAEAASGSPGLDPPYPAFGGLFCKEAVMLLRRFYMQENERGHTTTQS